MRDLARNGRCVRCEKAETGHLEVRETVSDAVVKAWDMFGRKGKIKFQGLQGDKTNEIHNPGYFELFAERMATVAWLSQ